MQRLLLPCSVTSLRRAYDASAPKPLVTRGSAGAEPPSAAGQLVHGGAAAAAAVGGWFLPGFLGVLYAVVGMYQFSDGVQDWSLAPLGLLPNGVPKC